MDNSVDATRNNNAPANQSDHITTTYVNEKQSLSSISDCTNNNFNLNFTVDYDPNLKTLLYGSYEYLEVVEIDGSVQSAIQLKDSTTFACLICNLSSKYDKLLQNLQEHIKSHRHMKNKSGDKLMAVSTYHKMWIRMEKSYQSHQVLFFPAGLSLTVCSVCCTHVQYDALKVHIDSDLHKSFVMQLYHKDRRYILMQLLASVYLPELNSVINLEQYVSMDRQHLQQKISVSLENTATSNAGKAENSTESEKKTITHNVIKSIANPLGKSLADILEHRFYPHLHLIEFVSNSSKVQCHCCDDILPNTPMNIKEHLYSRKHISKCNLPEVNWRFYCEVCDIDCPSHSSWHKHISDPKHNECCSRLGAFRKAKLCEYECTTCNIVIFGDELSIHRHTNARKRKKVIVLNKEIKQAFKSEQHIRNQCDQLVAIANGVLDNPDAMIKCYEAIEDILSKAFPNCKAHPFGSRVSGLGNEKSDLDVFVDVGNMYFGLQNQDSPAQVEFVTVSCKTFSQNRKEFSDIDSVCSARTPIAKVFHKATNIDCDISFRNGLSVENSKFLRFCIQVQPVTQSLILFLKIWVLQCRFNGRIHKYLSTYALAMLVIYFLQVKKYLLSVRELSLLSPDNGLIIDGWHIPVFSGLEDAVRAQIINNDKSIKQLLIDFFEFYRTFDYENNVICPLLGYTIKKSAFFSKKNGSLPLEMLPYVQKLENPQAEEFRAKSSFCLQDPFDLSHNLTKACPPEFVTKLTTYCLLSSKYLKAVH